MPAKPTIVTDPLTNRGTAFTEEERRRLGLIGRFPSAVETLDLIFCTLSLNPDDNFIPFSHSATKQGTIQSLQTVVIPLFCNSIFLHISFSE